MDGFDTAAKTWSIHIPGCGKLSEPWDSDPQHWQKWSEERSDPLIVVFGGIDVQGKYFVGFKDLQAETSYTSGTYMWDYVKKLKNLYHIFVADSPEVDGPTAYQKLMSLLHAVDRTPSRQILYLFSGGYKPGRALLSSIGSAPFKSIFLVDIWMGSYDVAKFYEDLVDSNAAKITYVHTLHAACNDPAREYIADKLKQRAYLVTGDGQEASTAVHVSTNAKAVSLIL